MFQKKSSQLTTVICYFRNNVVETSKTFKTPESSRQPKKESYTLPLFREHFQQNFKSNAVKERIGKSNF